MSHKSAHLAGKLSDRSKSFSGAQWYAKIDCITRMLISHGLHHILALDWLQDILISPQALYMRLRALQPITACRQDRPEL